MGEINLFIIGVIVFIVFYFLLREVHCWYFKINKRIEIEEENNKLLQAILLELTTFKQASLDTNISCQHKGETGRFCTQCGSSLL